MFAFAILIGVNSYIVFGMGMIGFLYQDILVVVTILYIVTVVFFALRSVRNFSHARLSHVKIFLSKRAPHSLFEKFAPHAAYPLEKVLLVLIAMQLCVNVIGALAPELAFDSLWYHLTFPKLYLETHNILYYPGSLFYYSVMPKLAEMVYIGALALQGETLAKILHLLIGVVTAISIYQIGNEYFTKRIGLLAAAIYYANLVVAWESTTAYVDLFVAFFYTLCIWAFFHYKKTNKRQWFIESAVMLGLAATTKLLFLGGVVIMIFIILKSEKKERIKKSLLYLLVSVLIPLPWIVFAVLNTGNPVYPIFSGYDYTISAHIFSPYLLFSRFTELFFHEYDPLSPLYAMFLPLVVLGYRKATEHIKFLCLFAAGGLVLWYLSYQQGSGGRYILPFLPAFSLLVASTVENYRNQKGVYIIFIMIITIISVITLGYRTFAVQKYVPVVFGMETKDAFLTKNLNFSYGDFYDTDGYFKKNVKPTDTVLLYGFHNLYYVDFRFIDSSYVKKGDTFTYIATQNTALPKQFDYFTRIYENKITHVKLYSAERKKWIY
jgi:hypothetical protein